MAVKVEDWAFDNGLDGVATTGDEQRILNAEPTDFADTGGAKLLGSVSMVGGDFTVQDGATSGRRVTVGAKTGASITQTGTANHLSIVDTVNSRLLMTTTTPATPVSSSESRDINSWEWEIADPTEV